MADKSTTADWERMVHESQALVAISDTKSDSGLIARHRQIAETLRTANQFVDPRLINGALTTKTGDWFRAEVEEEYRGKIPKGI